MVEQKNGGGPRPLGDRGTPSASAKRSVEQKCGIKIGGTKFWWGPMAEQKMVGGPWPLGGRGDP